MPEIGWRKTSSRLYWQTTDGTTARLYHGNVFDVLPTLASRSIDCVVTSPPYWMLRSYLPKGHPLKPHELGSEPTPAAFVANMVRVFALVRDALADHGTVWLNIGDTYAQEQVRSRHGQGSRQVHDTGGLNRPSSPGTRFVVGTARTDGKMKAGVESGSLCLIPQRLAIALSDDGWIVRSVIVWHKPAPMPASVAGWRWARCRVKVKGGKIPRHGNEGGLEARDAIHVGSGLHHAEWTDCLGCDRCRDHGGYVLRRGSWRPTGSWEPVLMLAKRQGYYADGEAVKQPPAAATVGRDKYTRVIDDPDEQFAVRHDHETVCNGANLRDVWTIGAEPLSGKHYAAFPTELVYRCLKAGTSARGYCPACGSPWARVVEQKSDDRTPYKTLGIGPYSDDSGRRDGNHLPKVLREDGKGGDLAKFQIATLGWRPTCACPGDLAPRPGVVLDPFVGSGRTCAAALEVGLGAVGVDLSEEYLRTITIPMLIGVLGRRRTTVGLIPSTRKPVSFGG